jgi:predicted dehydrogenase
LISIGIGIVGTSGIAAHYADKLCGITATHPAWIHSRSTERAERFAARHKIPRASNQLDALLADDSVQAVLILNEPGRHLAVARRCLAAGKHLLIEKPLAVDLADAKMFLNEAKHHQDQIISVISPYRFNPILAEMKATLDKEARNLPKTVVLSMMWHRDQAYYDKGDGWRRDHSPVFMNQGIHWLDVLNWFFGKPHAVHAASRASRSFLACPDQSSALVEYADGVSVIAAAGTFPAKVWPDQFTIYHAGGRLDYQELLGPTPPNGFRERLGRWLLKQPRWGRTLPDGMLLQLEDFFTAIRDNRPPLVTLGAGYAALELAATITRNAATQVR